MVLGVTNPYLIAAAMKTPEVQGFTLSQDIRDLAKQVEKLREASASGEHPNPRRRRCPQDLLPALAHPIATTWFQLRIVGVTKKQKGRHAPFLCAARFAAAPP
jgi:hypothetical protein